MFFLLISFQNLIDFMCRWIFFKYFVSRFFSSHSAELQIVRFGVMHFNDYVGKTVRIMQAHGLMVGQWTRKSCHSTRSVSLIITLISLPNVQRFKCYVNKATCKSIYQFNLFFEYSSFEIVRFPVHFCNQLVWLIRLRVHCAYKQKVELSFCQVWCSRQ